ncbi:MAG: DUF2851 family protein [Ktedonobacterales bacterium]
MGSLIVREREAEYASRWAAGEWRGATLTTAAGAMYTLTYEGRPGGGPGPDFRDAVLRDASGRRLCGDVELHLRASGWRLHGHDRDPRYAQVVLHVVVRTPAAGAPRVSPNVRGGGAPIVPLGSIVPGEPPRFPCEDVAAHLGPARLRALLLALGDARFAARSSAFAASLAAVPEPHDPLGQAPPRGAHWDAPGRVLCVALAEALAYGRDREPLRRAGERLAASDGLSAPGDRGSAALSSVERARLRGLLALAARWGDGGPWPWLRHTLAAGTARQAGEALAAALAVPDGAISRGRARILLANVALPFAAAVDPSLASRARAVYAALPGLPSNQITRAMGRQLGLPRQPAGARAQLGLHHLWASACREKRCDACPCGAHGEAPICYT